MSLSAEGAKAPAKSAATAQSKAPQKPEKWIGVKTGPLMPGVRSHLKKHLAGVPGDAGLMIYNVAPESPAVVAGLEKFDVLLRADGQPLVNAQKLQEILSQRNFGTSVRLDIIHEGQPKTVYALVLEKPESEPSQSVHGLAGNPVSIMVVGGDGKGSITPSGAKVSQRLVYTDVNGQRHELTGDQIAEFHKRMREDEAFRKSVKQQEIQMEMRVETSTGGSPGAAGSTVSASGTSISIQTTTSPQ
jgi:hypothetical protein